MGDVLLRLCGLDEGQGQAWAGWGSPSGAFIGPDGASFTLSQTYLRGRLIKVLLIPEVTGYPRCIF